MQNNSSVDSVANAVISAALGSGAEATEVFIQDSKELVIKYCGEEVESICSGEDRGIGIRVIVNGKVGLLASTDLELDYVTQRTRELVRLVSQLPEDRATTFALPSGEIDEFVYFDQGMPFLTVEDRLKILERQKEECFSTNQSIDGIDSLEYFDAISKIHLFNSFELRASYPSTVCSLFLCCTCSEGNRYGVGSDGAIEVSIDRLAKRKVGERAAKKALIDMLGRPAKDQESTIILAPEPAALLLSHLAKAVSGDQILKNQSMWIDKLGHQVASPLVNIYDDRLYPFGVETAPVDGEGVGAQKTVVIEQGILKSWLHDMATASVLHGRSTGNTSRNSFRDYPVLNCSNFYLKPGQQTEEQLIQCVSEGLYVYVLTDIGSINYINGQFAAYAAGYWIERGRLTCPITSTIISGKLDEILFHISGVANNLEWYGFAGNFGSPSIRVDHVHINGE